MKAKTLKKPQPIMVTAPDSPTYLDPKPENFPPELAEREQWVCWSVEWRDGNLTKPPMRASSPGKFASAKAPRTWASLQSALDGYQRTRMWTRGVGFVTTRGDLYTVVDLDKCRNPETGEIDDWAIDIAHEIDSYTEVSPSATGLRMIARGKIPVLFGKSGGKSHGRSHAPDKLLEMYCDIRYVTMTGHTIEGFPTTIRDAQDALDTVYRREIHKEPPQKPAARQQHKTNGSASDDDILRIVRKAKNSAKFDRLWSGDTAGYASQSEADLALCDMLAFYTGHDEGRLDRLFRQSGLYRDKWDRDDYRSETIRKSLEGRTEFFQWRTPSRSAPPPSDDQLDYQSPEGRTDLANARRFVKRYQGSVHYCHPWSKWLIWDRQRHCIDNTGAALKLASRIADDAWQAVKDLDNPEGAKPLIQFATYTAKTANLKAFMSIAASLPGVPILHTQLDAHPWLLNCQNGTVDLRTGELAPHDRDHYLTRLCPTPYNPKASSYHWDRFLESIFIDQPVIDFVQRWFGYCLTGDVREDLLAIFWGDGSNGKTTLLNAFMQTIGRDFVMKAVPELLMHSESDRHPTEKADLFGMRFVACVETEQGRRLNETIVKELTGRDPITARRMREDFWQFDPTHKIVLCTNHKPALRGTDHAIRRRLALVPFTVKFWDPDKGEDGPPELRVDKTLPGKIAAEAEGILAWAVRGCRDWLTDGLRMPNAVRVATDSFVEESDTFGRFIREECCCDDIFSDIAFSGLYDAFKLWFEANEDGRVPSKKALGQYLIARGYQQSEGWGRRYKGISLLK